MKRYELVNILVIAISAIILIAIANCAAAAPKVETPAPTEVKAPEAPPIQVDAPSVALATIDPKTLKVTYAKGTNPKAVVDQVVKAWATAMGQLNACQTQLKDKK